MSIFKDCDIRGIYGEGLTEREVYKIGRGLSAMLPEGGTFAVGGDVRVSTPALKQALMDGLVRGGLRVTDLGTIPTPVLYFVNAMGRFDGCATVTASHNPAEYNGIKFILGGEVITPQVICTLKDIVLRGEYPRGKGSVEHYDPIDDYLASFARRFGTQKKLRIVVDAGNGAMSKVAPNALRAAGHEVFELFCTPDGRFPNRSPNPAEYSVLGALCKRVPMVGADFGVAFDGDGDRAVFVDDLGRPVQNEKTLVQFIREMLKNRPTPVVYDQKSSSVIRKATLEMGGEPVPERSGHAFIKRHFLEVGAAVAGEVSGHFFFGELGYDDGLFAAFVQAEILSGTEKHMSEISDAIALPPITPDLRLACPYAMQDIRLKCIEEKARREDLPISRLDGVRIEFPKGWLLVRKSVTAEQITVRAEAETEKALVDILKWVGTELPEDAGRYLLSNAVGK